MPELKYGIDAVESVLNIARNVDGGTEKWVKDPDVLTAKYKGKKIVIAFPEKYDSGEFVITAQQATLNAIKDIITRSSTKLDATTINQTIFTGQNESDIRDRMNIGQNGYLFLEFAKWIKKLGFESAKVRVNNTDQFFSEKLTLFVAPLVGTSLPSSFCDDVKKKYPNLSYGFPKIDLAKDEQIVEIMGKKGIMGHHYTSRNCVVMFINPLFGKNSLYEFDADPKVKEMLDEFATGLKKVKMKQVDVSNISMKIIVAQLVKKFKDRLKSNENEVKNLENNIETYQRQLVEAMEQKKLAMCTIDGIKSFMGREEEYVIKEFKAGKKLELVEDITFDDGNIVMKFRPTTVKAKVNATVEGDVHKGDLYEMFVGSISLIIKPDGSFYVDCDHPGPEGKKHPHAQTNGHPCIGSGTGAQTLTKFIAERALSQLAYVFWMWIRKWRPEDCYIKPYAYIKDRLQKGLPVFDVKGKRIYLDDAKLIKNGIITKDDKKLPGYDANLKKYAKFKPQR